MAESTKSVLLLDYDSLYRSLAGSAAETRLAERAAAWLSAMESGRLLSDEGHRRRISLKRCYVGPGVRGKPRDALAVAGFELVDATETGGRNAADLLMAMDTVELLARGDDYDEFILLSSGTDLAPLLSRLKSARRLTAIYADESTADKDKATADQVLDKADFVRLLASEPRQSEAKPAPAPATAAQNERADIETFARRIHAATNIPLFSPRTFAELFRHLTDEIAANGYHFQSTAKNVAERMVAGGRNVNRRQVVFIVKGLALKGHVFSTNDTPERLSEVFREQARYLIGNAGIKLTEHEENLLSAWFLSRPPPSTLPRPEAALPPPPPPPAQSPVIEAPAAAKAAIAETIEREVAKAVAKPAPEKKPPAARPPPVIEHQPRRSPAVRPVDLPKSAAAKPVPLPTAREDAKAVIAARIAGAAKMKPAPARPPAPPKAPPPPEPAAEEEAPPRGKSRAPAASAPATPEDSDALENSILAAIAEAVDVLVEDSASEPEDSPPAEHEEEAAAEEAPSPPARRRRNSHPEPAEPDYEGQPEEPDDESSDIGDQIQRIIASYNRGRNE